MTKVYFIDLRCSSKQNLLDKFKKLLNVCGLVNFDYNRKLVAIKMHFGEPGNLAYVRPNYVTLLAGFIKERNGLPFLTDCNTLYKGKRSNAVEHIESAYQNGFNPLTTGCNIIIADGLKGNNYREIEINMKNCKTAKIGTAIADADIIISFNHFKGHEMTGFGGAIKNLGMGSGSVGGKLFMHSDSQPYIERQNCTGCGVCVENCQYSAISLDNQNIAVINYQICTGCGQCISVCRFDAPQARLNAINLQEKIAEYAYAVIKSKPSFHINFITDVSPNCDCWNFNDAPVVPNIGILASSDPVAIDRASVDMVNNAPVLQNCTIADKVNVKDKFSAIHPNTNWQHGLDYAEKIGLGSQKYELVVIK
jgi:uncharacterized Fe-S center protein